MKELAKWDPTDIFDTVVDRFRALAHPEWTMAARVIETLIRTRRATNVSELRGWARKVRRFLLDGPATDGRRGLVRQAGAPVQG
jgi:hypothetical protein